MAEIGMAEVIESGIMRCWCRRSDCSILSMLIFIALSFTHLQYCCGGDGDCAEGWRARMTTRLKFIRVMKVSPASLGLTTLDYMTPCLIILSTLSSPPPPPRFFFFFLRLLPLSPSTSLAFKHLLHSIFSSLCFLADLVLALP